MADYGMYKCVAKNPRGETDGTIRLYGKFKLSFYYYVFACIIDVLPIYTHPHCYGGCWRWLCFVSVCCCNAYSQWKYFLWKFKKSSSRHRRRHTPNEKFNERKRVNDFIFRQNFSTLKICNVRVCCASFPFWLNGWRVNSSANTSFFTFFYATLFCVRFHKIMPKMYCVCNMYTDTVVHVCEIPWRASLGSIFRYQKVKIKHPSCKYRYTHNKL